VFVARHFDSIVVLDLSQDYPKNRKSLIDLFYYIKANSTYFSSVSFQKGGDDSLAFVA
jgi:hypothetical protein